MRTYICVNCGKEGIQLNGGKHQMFCSHFCKNEVRRKNNQEHPEIERQRQKEWRDKNPEKQRAKSQRYKDKNPELVKFRTKRWRENNPDKVKDYELRTRDNARIRGKKYRHSPKGRTKMKVQQHKRYARKRNLPDNWTVEDWQRALDYFNNCCAVCGRPQGLWHTLSRDHWIPLDNPNCPGTVATNIVPLCHGIDGCNNSKRNHEPTEWLISKFGKRKAAQILNEIETYFKWVQSQSRV